MTTIIGITLKGIFRDRVFQGIMVTACAFLLIPVIASLSMRQVTELSLTLSLSLISFILLLLAVFLGGTSLWKDIERRYTFSVLGLPISRQSYMIGRFGGVALFVLLAAAVLGAAAFAVVTYSSAIYPPDRPIVWSTMALCILFDALKYILLIAVAFLFSTVSTSFFLPVFGAIATFLVGGVTQQVYEFINSPASKTLSPFVKQIAIGLYYILPNFGAFDLKVNAIYSLPLHLNGLFLTAAYFIAYVGLLLSVAAVIFARREMR
ncbi:MAG: ABC transporter permease [Desulfuromonadaceae bacterium]|nr:ABC transporter permease [Desulfuromonadaceae bacterium]MDD2847020.1 ABC transporter permease [Desulfuromonadaceae bacterium]MDD4129002.1 ABC transporter permease [Desulfuromonadaceae bacterium]